MESARQKRLKAQQVSLARRPDFDRGIFVGFCFDVEAVVVRPWGKTNELSFDGEVISVPDHCGRFHVEDFQRPWGISEPLSVAIGIVVGFYRRYIKLKIRLGQRQHWERQSQKER